jgi:hypothetical protein
MRLLGIICAITVVAVVWLLVLPLAIVASPFIWLTKGSPKTP